MLWYVCPSLNCLLSNVFRGGKLGGSRGLLRNHPYGDLPTTRIHLQREWEMLNKRCDMKQAASSNCFMQLPRNVGWLTSVQCGLTQKIEVFINTAVRTRNHMETNLWALVLKRIICNHNGSNAIAMHFCCSP
jgi:hypothetical protein